MKYSVNSVKSALIRCVNDLSSISYLFSKNPSVDFTRTRKLPFKHVITSLLCMGGGSISNELMDYFNLSPNIPSSSAFVQQRSKILPEAFETLFHMFNSSVGISDLYRGFRLLAVDGSDIHIPTNPHDKDSYYPGTNGQKPYNILHLNALYDLKNDVYVDAIVQKSRRANEHDAFIRMIDRFNTEQPAIFIGDRGYESYNNMAHIQEKGHFFLIRVKDGRGGIANGLDLPDKNEFDMPVSLLLTRKQTNETKQLCKNKNRYKFIPHNIRFDYLSKNLKKYIPTEFYELRFRVVRFKVTEDLYETVLTNLDSDKFSSEELKKLYAMRWGIETSFRGLKYTVGLLHFHSKKTEYILQEIFAGLIMYNFTKLIISCIIVKQKDRKYLYKINFSAAVHICRRYIHKSMSPSDIEALILKYIVPVRPCRRAQRNSTQKTVISFLYRVS